ncbi:MAG: hypothetical protein F6K54_32685 [Okeania sp. SIO3B5]|uniref:hypothetical protein n=1 Tax=Okeania sp. SIO3B5 TaxID=2607811 RepID=UPI0014003C7F|nr:hypothetical protein [Okeania sp. SIO3B5]NEO57419.1 hypothetical protein [Okeania sp. SIO3B5]
MNLTKKMIKAGKIAEILADKLFEVASEREDKFIKGFVILLDNFATWTEWVIDTGEFDFWISINGN